MKTSTLPPTLLELSMKDHELECEDALQLTGNKSVYLDAFIKPLQRIEKIVKTIEIAAPSRLSRLVKSDIFNHKRNYVREAFLDIEFYRSSYYLTAFRGGRLYSLRVELLLAALNDHLDLITSWCSEEIAQTLIRDIHKRATTPNFRVSLSRQTERRKRQLKGMQKLVDDLFACYARLLVVRVDLGYLKGPDGERSFSCNTFNPSEDVNIAIQHRNDLINKMRFKSEIFAHCVGYITKLEQGVQGSYHFHTVFFFDGSKVYSEYFYAKSIGEYWQNSVTKGLGRFHACSASRTPVKRAGIGLINYYEIEKINSLKNAALRYLAKEEQCLIVKPESRIAVITRSNSPRMGVKRGRNRNL